jgi:urease accessory protein
MGTKRQFITLLGFSLLLALPQVARAHPNHGVANVACGFAHPFTGLDHLLAMLALGLWATQLGRRAMWLVPAAFVSLMVLGGAIAHPALNVWVVESGILASVVILGLRSAFAIKPPTALGMLLVAVFALFHGCAHFAEMNASSAIHFAAGFACSTALLNAVGIGLGTALIRFRQVWVVRFSGALIALAGVMMIAARI